MFFSLKPQQSFSFPLHHISVSNSFVLSFISYFYETCLVLVRDMHDAQSQPQSLWLDGEGQFQQPDKDQGGYLVTRWRVRSSSY